jgi:hypothetical protein
VSRVSLKRLRCHVSARTRWVRDRQSLLDDHHSTRACQSVRRLPATGPRMFESFDIFNPRPVRRSSDNPVIRKIQHAHAGQSFVPSVLPGAATRRTFPFEANGTTSIKRSTGRERRSTFSCAVTAASRRHKRSFRKALATNLNRWPRKVTLDGHVPSHRALRLLRREDPKWRNIEVRTCKYLNNIVGAPGKVWRFQRVKIPHRQGASHPTGNRALGLWR